MKEIQNSNQRVCVHVFVSGKVQGVGYRFATKRQARIFGINGWVRNLEDKRVEAIFEGDAETVNKMVKWCYKGSVSAEVTGVSSSSETP